MHVGEGASAMLGVPVGSGQGFLTSTHQSGVESLSGALPTLLALIKRGEARGEARGASTLINYIMQWEDTRQ
jgi:hypothetical protein